MTRVMAAFCERFNKMSTQKLMSPSGEKHVFGLGNVKDGLRNG
jgi:hypothetical protein